MHLLLVRIETELSIDWSESRQIYSYFTSTFSHPGQLASYKRLDGGVYFVDELPVTASGKVIQSKVKPMAQSFYQIRKQKQSLSKL